MLTITPPMRTENSYNYYYSKLAQKKLYSRMMYKCKALNNNHSITHSLGIFRFNFPSSCCIFDVFSSISVVNVTKCQFFDDDGCQIEFTYEFDEDFNLQVVVKITRSKLCKMASLRF
jgi:hypothetical protein